MTANVICTLSGRPKNSISRAVIKLTYRGLIKSVVDPEDRRRSLLTITTSGKTLYEEMMPICRVQEEKMFGFLSKADLAMLDDILLRVLRNWSYQFAGTEQQPAEVAPRTKTRRPRRKTVEGRLDEVA